MAARKERASEPPTSNGREANANEGLREQRRAAPAAAAGAVDAHVREERHAFGRAVNRVVVVVVVAAAFARPSCAPAVVRGGSVAVARAVVGGGGAVCGHRRLAARDAEPHTRLAQPRRERRRMREHSLGAFDSYSSLLRGDILTKDDVVKEHGLARDDGAFVCFFTGGVQQRECGVGHSTVGVSTKNSTRRSGGPASMWRRPLDSGRVE